MSGEDQHYTALGDQLAPEFDFKAVCSCTECSSKISEFKKFQEDLKSIKKQVMKRIGKMGVFEEQTFMISLFAGWMRSLFFLLQHKLREAVGQLEEGYSHNPMEDAVVKIGKKLAEVGYFPLGEAHNNTSYKENQSLLSESVAHGIEEAIDLCKRSRCELEVRPILDKILDFQNQHEECEKSAEARGETLYLGEHIKLQIEELMNLPDILECKVDDLIADISPIIEQLDMLYQAVECIEYSERNIMEMRRIFRELIMKGQAKGHDLSGEAIHSLSNLVKDFKDQWKEEWTNALNYNAVRKRKPGVMDLRGASEELERSMERGSDQLPSLQCP